MTPPTSGTAHPDLIAIQPTSHSPSILRPPSQLPGLIQGMQQPPNPLSLAPQPRLPSPANASSTTTSSSAAPPGSSVPLSGPSRSPVQQARRRESQIDDQRPQRAPQACERCRRKKLRCVGGCPCLRCQRSKSKCDFGPRIPEGDDQPAGLDPTIRLAQLEKAVANLVNSLSTIAPDATNALSRLASFPKAEPPPQPMLPPPTTTTASSAGHVIPQALTNGHAHPHPPGPMAPDPSYGQPFPPPFHSPFGHNSNASVSDGHGRVVQFGPSPTDSATGGLASRGRKDTPESRLGIANQAGSGFAAPFQALTYQPALWENREQSRRASPVPGAPPSRDEGWSVFEAKAGPKDDPVTEGIVDIEKADALFNFYFDRCHPYLPIIHFSRSDLPHFMEIRQRCAFLFTTILAIAGRFYPRHQAKFPNTNLPTVDSEASAAMAQLAYSHLAASLFRKQHQLMDVQATLLLAGWGLQSGGRGPDPWLVTGHCARLAHRLGLHRLGSNPALTNIEGLDEEGLDKLLTQWKTWLCWFHFDGFLSLGFGRPQTTQLEAVNEHLYLQALQTRPNSPELASDVYIASLVQLTKIGRDLINWLQMLTDWHAEGVRVPLVRDDQDYSICAMMRELNKRLDDWTRTWAWNGSLYAIQLGPCSRLAKLQSEHVRLCLNSIALKPGLQENATGEDAVLMQNCIRHATESALNTIQTHFDAAKTDMILSYSVDYITITLGQAAVFLIRLHTARYQIPVDRAVLAHYLRMAIELLEDTDLSETKNSTYVAKVCRDLCRVGNVDVPPREGMMEDPFTHQDLGIPLAGGDGFTSDFDLESFLQFDGSGLDLGFMLGLPADGLPNAAPPVSTGRLPSVEVFGTVNGAVPTGGPGTVD